MSGDDGTDHSRTGLPRNSNRPANSAQAYAMLVVLGCSASVTLTVLHICVAAASQRATACGLVTARC